MKKKYDVFISCKSEDYPLAEEISAFLRNNEIIPFLASESLRRVGNAAYLDEIDKALDESQHLIVFCSNPQYADSTFVKEEWQSFRNEKLSGRKSGNILTVVANEITISQLPYGLRRYEVIPFSEFKKVLLNYVCSAIENLNKSVDCRNISHNNTKKEKDWNNLIEQEKKQMIDEVGLDGYNKILKRRNEKQEFKLGKEGNKYRIGKYTFDPYSNTLEYGAQQTKLCNKESELLYLLYMNANKTVETAYILKKIWIDVNYFNTRSMKNYILKLQNKISNDNSIKIIEIKEVGFKLIAN